jgi:AcrR family transcriptional regulator
MPFAATTPAPKRQARGEARIDQILLAAAACFGEQGYEATTTNGIAARAGISPGSLYQFFKNKEDVAHALATRYLEQLSEVQNESFTVTEDVALEQVVSSAVKAIVDFNLAHPGFKALFARPDMPESMREAAAPVNDRLHERVREMVAALIPALDDERLEVTVLVVLHTVKGLLPPIVAATEPMRSTLVGELEHCLTAYLRSVAASAAST